MTRCHSHTNSIYIRQSGAMDAHKVISVCIVCAFDRCPAILLSQTIYVFNMFRFDFLNFSFFFTICRFVFRCAPSPCIRFDELHRLPFDSVIENSEFGSKTSTAFLFLLAPLINIHSRNAFLSSHKFSVVFHLMEASRFCSFPE